METNDLKSYQLRLQCQKCGKFIDVDFYVKLNERNQYGKEEESFPKKLPDYVVMALGEIPNYLEDLRHRSQKYTQSSLASTWATAPLGYAQSQPIQQSTHQEQPIIRCQECIKLDSLKE
jgi:hypothetical protein